MKIDTFELERRQSLWENTVEYNLTESGIHPFTISELLDDSQIKQLLDLRLGYGQTNGSIELRDSISKLYPDASQDNVFTTNGSAEANFVSIWSNLNPNDELVLMLPNYMQIWGIARSFGVSVKPFHLKEELQWQPDMDEIRKLITPKTKMIVVCNPNNPTGSIMTNSNMEELIDIANESSAWILSDEVYRGAELDGKEITSFYGKYDKVIAVGGLSKAYSLPGLRMGWIVAPEDIAEKSWLYHDYTSISPGVLSQQIATWALEPSTRQKILSRNRKMLNENLSLFQNWLDKRKHLFDFIPQKAGAMSFVRYHFDMNSTVLTERLRKEKSLLIVAGDCFGMDNYLRLGIGSEKEFLLEGLQRLEEGLEEFVNA
jgi:aspartate/methionine/tyrosine aminotransferase